MLLACEPAIDRQGLPDAVPPDVIPRFSPGDRLEIKVFEEEDLTGEFQVQEDGTIDYPLIGRVEVAGKTQSEVQRRIQELLRDGYLVDPQVHVNVVERQNLDVSVLGQVKEPGTFPYVDNLTLVQAISDAGGTTPVANPRKVRLTRRTAKGAQTFEINLREITAGRRDDIRLQAGDIVYVPESPI